MGLGTIKKALDISGPNISHEPDRGVGVQKWKGG